ncbi:MAG: tetratricopeptide repeat protein [Deltaproteobacteria bacterium]|nr:MAG: tetratricopeptide repeat protein [Deltaproteobacteria bacterium]
MSEHEPIDERVREWADDRVGTAPTLETAQLLIARADARERRTQAVWVTLSLAASVLLALVGAGGLLLANLGLDDPQPLAVHVLRADGSAVAHGASLAVTDEGSLVAKIGEDRIAIDGHTHATVTRHDVTLTEIALIDGTLAAEVAPRPKGHFFQVRAPDVLVTVVGTLFLVDTDGEGTRVAVSEGAVEVRHGEELWTVNPGQQLWVPHRGNAVLSALDGELPEDLFAEPAPAEPEAPVEVEPELAPAPVTAPTPKSRPSAPAPDPVKQARAQLLAGDPTAAIALLEPHLAASPSDAGAWTLLATAHRKAGHPDRALEAWREVIARGSDAEVRRGRFEAASMLQAAESHEAAVLELQALLATPSHGGSLEPEVRLRLGRSLLATGRDAEGRAQLVHLTEHFPGTAAAEAAQTLLRE